MKQTRLFILTFLLATVSCDKVSHLKSTPVKIQKSAKEVLPAPLIVRLQKGKGTVLAEMKLSFQGSKRIESHLNEQKETVQNLVIQTASDFTYDDLQSSHGRADFQVQLLSSINDFVDSTSFKKINIIEIKEI